MNKIRDLISLADQQYNSPKIRRFLITLVPYLAISCLQKYFTFLASPENYSLQYRKNTQAVKALNDFNNLQFGTIFLVYLLILFKYLIIFLLRKNIIAIHRLAADQP